MFENHKKSHFWRVLLKPEDSGQTVLPDRSILIGQKLVKIAKIEKFKMRHLDRFSNTVCRCKVWNFSVYSSR